MEWVVSEDGTAITYHLTGKPSGNDKPALLLVHGTGGSFSRWEPVMPMLDPFFQVYAMVRRGRTTSLENASYSLEVEYQDILALVEKIHKDGASYIYVLGHSFGGLCALEATYRTSLVDKLVLYEPLICGLGVQVFPDHFLKKIEHLQATNDREGMITAFLGDVVSLSPVEMERFRHSKKWNDEIASAHTLPRELKAAIRYQFDERRFMSMPTPTLLLCGSESPPYFKVAADLIEQLLPCCYQQFLQGQHHVAMDTAPELFAGAVIDFLSEAKED